MLLREINIGNLTVIVNEEQGKYEMKALEQSGNRAFLHIYEDYEIVKCALDGITDLMEKESVQDEEIIDILRQSKDK